MSITYRPIGTDDHSLICHHREAMFRDMGRDEKLLAEMRKPFADWLAPRLADNRYIGVMAEHDGRVIAGAGIFLIDWPPHMRHPTTSERGYVLNVYTEPPFRRQGIARRLMELCDEAIAKRGIPLAVLHASTTARPLYEGMGWFPSNEMMKTVIE